MIMEAKHNYSGELTVEVGRLEHVFACTVKAFAPLGEIDKEKAITPKRSARNGSYQ